MSAAAIRRKWTEKERLRSSGYTYQFKLLIGQEYELEKKLHGGDRRSEGIIESSGQSDHLKTEAGQGEAGKSTEGQDEQQGGSLHPIWRTPRPPTLMSLAIPIFD